MPQKKYHRAHRTGWLRAAVLGADDGIVSTTSLVLGVAAAHSTRAHILLAAVSGLVAGAMAMAAGEYVSVSSQRDVELADLALERASLSVNRSTEQNELAAIYVERGLEPDLARKVAYQLMAYDALATHARDELGLNMGGGARPLQAAFVSAVTFTAGAFLPVLTVTFTPQSVLPTVAAAISLSCLAVLGGFAARAGGAPVLKGAGRVLLWGTFAMALTTAAGSMFAVAP